MITEQSKQDVKEQLNRIQQWAKDNPNGPWAKALKEEQEQIARGLTDLMDRLEDTLQRLRETE